MKLKLNTTHQVCLILGLLALGGIIGANFSLQILIHLSATLGFGIILFFVFKLIFKKNKKIWNTIISCLIIFLILQPGFFWAALIATGAAVFSKFFLEYKSSPIINPVILGLLALTIIAKIFPENITAIISWWGASYKIQAIPVSLIMMAVWIIFGFKSLRKFTLLFAYLIIYAVLILILYRPIGSSSWDFLKFTFTDSTIYFFASVMLIEPRTSPFLKSQQTIYGILAAIFSTLSIFFGMQMLALFAIIIPNLYFLLMKIIISKKTSAKEVLAPQ